MAYGAMFATNEGLSVGCVLDGPAKCLWVLGHYRFEAFLRSACLEWPYQTLCSHALYLGVSTLHRFKIYIFHGFISKGSGHHNFSYNLFISHTLLDSAGYPQILDVID
jgi:hypothetical protein